MSFYRFAPISLGIMVAFSAVAALGAEPKTPCNEDAMIVFDASGSMSGTVGLGIATPVTRID
jgi:Ca-activated chloride channel family protein